MLSSDIPQIFIGLNDSGKSTVLQSIDLLLGDKPKYNSISEGNYKSDLANSPKSFDEINQFLGEKNLPLMEGDGNATFIFGKLKYTEVEGDEYIDFNLSAPLKWSLESNSENTLWIAKRFSVSSIQTYLLFHDSNPTMELWNMNQTNLNHKITEHGVTKKDIGNENGVGRFSNFEKIRAVYGKVECSLNWAEFKYAKNDKDIFPVFNIFDWNCSLDEIVNTANAIMQDEIDNHLKPLKERANTAAAEAEIAINEKFGEISNIIKQVAKGVESINSKVYFDVKEKISDIMVTKSNSDGPIHLENQGEGLKRQIWFSLIKAKADDAANGKNKFIWAFDEPETHLYPRAQRDFFDILQKVSLGNVQTLISTHSTIFIDKSKLNRINNVRQNDTGYTEIDKCEDVDAIYSSLSVKNSDFLFYDKFLVVEGDTEQYLIPKLFELYKSGTLLDFNIQLINIQGKDK